MLNVKSLEAKNFLSYGDVWTKVELNTGISLITGLDEQKKRSNGAGKTSFMEIIIFSLFGQVSKDLKQSQIVNWKNKKSCETKVTFTKGNNEYTFHRGLKPNFIKVSKDGIDYPINSSVKDFQNDLEDQVIGMDFKTFNSLIYSNPNNSISLLDTPKAQKRAFIERQFNLTEFSKLNELNNSTIKELNLEIHDIKRDIDKVHATIFELETNINMINDVIATSSNKLEVEILNKVMLVGKLNEFKDIDDTGLSDLKELVKSLRAKIDNLRADEKELEKSKNTLKMELMETITTVKSLKKQRDDIGDVTENLEKYDKVKKALSLYDDVENILEAKKKSIISLEEGYELIKENYNEHTSIINGHKTRLKEFNIDGIKDKTQCPTCYQDVDYATIKEKVDSQIDVINHHLTSEEEKRAIIKSSMDDFKLSISQKKEDIELFEDKLKKKQELEKSLIKLEVYKTKQAELEVIDGKIKSLSNYSDKKATIDKYVTMISDTTLKISEITNDVISTEKTIDDTQEKLNKKNTLQKDIDISSNNIKHGATNIQNQKDSLSDITIKLDTLKKNIEVSLTSLDEKQNLMSHLEYIKSMLKDENIKQFAISNMIPLIESKTNYYLGEAGFGFYLKLDNWLEAEIKGPGISECSFSSMSGGERKSIDLALKFAIMDISVARNPDFPDILILDELLDSSVDSYGIQQLMEVVKVKQRKNNLKVFIISHRAEMDEFEADNRYLIRKKNGFSSVEILN